MKPEDLRPGDILRDPKGQLWNVEQVLGDRVLVYQRRTVLDLTGWQEVQPHQFTEEDNKR